MTARNTKTGKARRNGGFSLIELLAVVTIIAIIASIAMPQYQHAISKAREAALKQNLYLMRSLIDQYFADKGHYPSSLETLVDDGYMRQKPTDPFTNSSASWIEVPAEESPLGMPDIAPGIEDIKSGAPGIGSNGIPYNQW